MRASVQFERVVENVLKDGFMPFPAVSGKALYLRIRKSLYRIETSPDKL